MDPRLTVGGLAVVVLAFGAILALRRWRRSSARRRSRRAHEAATEREPPVELGETYEVGVREFTDHHSGTRVAVGKVEGFVLFVEDVPGDVETGEVISVRVLSFNTGHTSADATFVATV